MVLNTGKAKRSRAYRNNRLGQEPGSFLHPTPSASSLTASPALSLTALVYNESEGQTHQNVLLADVTTLLQALKHNEKQWLWLNIEGNLTTEVLEWLKVNLAIEALTLEDLMNQQQRPKVEAHNAYSYWVLHMLQHQKQAKEKTKGLLPLQYEPLHMLLATRCLVTLQPYCDGDFFDGLRQKLMKPPSHRRFSQLGSAYLAYSLLDTTVDHYFVVHGTLEESLEALEQLLIRDEARHRSLLDRLYQHKRQLNQCRRLLLPTYELVLALAKEEELNLPKGMKPYLRDLQDHLAQLQDYNESLSEETDGFIAMYLSLVNYRSNEVVQTLTLVSSIFMPLTFIVGIYGMNFEHMPELAWPYGYPLCLLVMMLMSLACFAYFKKKRWL
jgi:magnesium transporter